MADVRGSVNENLPNETLVRRPSGNKNEQLREISKAELREPAASTVITGTNFAQKPILGH